MFKNSSSCKLFVFISAIFIFSALKSQSFLNGNFEINSCTAGIDQINLSNAAFNAFMSNNVGFGSNGNLDIITTATYAGGPESGNWYVGMTGGGTDAMSMQLSSALVAGNTYTVCFWDKADPNFADFPVILGVSNSPTTFGTLVYTAPFAPLDGVWTQRTATFVAPISGLYITVEQGGASNLQNWINVDNFTFCCNINVSLGNDTTICQGDSLTLNAQNPGSTYLWSNGATTQTITVGATGSYWVNVSSINCSASDTINISVSAPPVVNLGNDTTICSPNTLTLNAGNAGATYLWSTGANTQTITVSTTGIYWVTASVGACSSSDTISVTFNTGPTVNLGNDTTLCNGQLITLNAGNPGDTYLWSTGANTQTISPVVSGTYSVMVTNGNCTAGDTIIVTFSAPPVVHLGNDTTLCSPGSLTLNAGNAGATYLWSTGANTQTINVTTTGIYWVVASLGQCTGTDTISVTFNPPPVVALGNDTTLCSGQPITLNAGNAGDTYLWSNSGVTQTINPVVSGTYSVTVSAGSCTANGSITVTFTPLPVVNLGPDQNLCNVPNVTLNAGNPGDTYLWSTGANTQTITVSTAGQYWVTVNNGTCAGSDTVNINFGNSSTVNLGPDVTICPGASVVLNAGNAGMQYQWSTGETTQTISVNTTGTYWVNVSNGSCEGSDTINVKVSPQPIVSLGNDTAICPGDQFVINAGKGYNGYSWTPGGENSAVIIVNQPGTYAVTVTDTNGCTASSSILLKQFCPSDMFVPSAFNPGGSLNYMFLPVCENVVDYQLYIYDRWGQLLFESEDISTGWDGTFNGSASPQGVYVYRIDYKLYDFSELMKHTKTGTVTLIR